MDQYWRVFSYRVFYGAGKIWVKHTKTRPTPDSSLFSFRSYVERYFTTKVQLSSALKFPKSTNCQSKSPNHHRYTTRKRASLYSWTNSPSPLFPVISPNFFPTILSYRSVFTISSFSFPQHIVKLRITLIWITYLFLEIEEYLKLSTPYVSFPRAWIVSLYIDIGIPLNI